MKPLALMALPMAAIALIMSTTKAALGALVVVFLCIPIYRAFRWKTKYLVAFLSVGLPLIGGMLAAVVGNADSLFQAIGKDTTLSGAHRNLAPGHRQHQSASLVWLRLRLLLAQRLGRASRQRLGVPAAWI